MKPVPEARTIVLAGSWNLAILNPNWVAEQIFRAEGVEVEIVVSEAQTRLRYSHDGVAISPQANRVVFTALLDSNECLQRAEDLAAKLLELLPLTPMGAVGFNFPYEEDPVPENIAAIFNTVDLAAIGRAGFDVKATSLSRTLAFEDRELRFRLTLADQTKLRAQLNFHKPTASGALARAAILAKAVAYRAAGEAMLQDIYDLRLEEAA